VFTRATRWILSWATWIQSTTTHTVSYILTLAADSSGPC
jgi:hypothetical protein